MFQTTLANLSQLQYNDESVARRLQQYLTINSFMMIDMIDLYTPKTKITKFTNDADLAGS